MKVGYPALLKTNYKYDEKTQQLTVLFDEEYGGRIFELALN